MPETEDEEYVYARVKCHSKKFLVLVRDKEAYFKNEYNLKVKHLVKRGFSEAEYEGPILPGVAVGTTVKDSEGSVGLILGVTSVDDMDSLLQSEEVGSFFKDAQSVSVTDQWARTPAKLLKVLELCGNCSRLTINVIKWGARSDGLPDAEEEKKARDEEPVVVSLPKVQTLVLDFDEFSRGTMTPEDIFYEHFTDLEVEDLRIHHALLTPKAVDSLCSSSLSELVVSGSSDSEYELLFQAMEVKKVHLDSFIASGINMPAGSSSSIFEHLQFLLIANTSTKSLYHLLPVAGKKLKSLYLQNIAYNMFPWKDFAEVIEEECPSLQDLGVFGCWWFNYYWFDRLSAVWQSKGRKKLREFKFDQACGLHVDSFSDPHALNEKDSRATDLVLALPKMHYPHYDSEPLDTLIKVK